MGWPRSRAEGTGLVDAAVRAKFLLPRHAAPRPSRHVRSWDRACIDSHTPATPAFSPGPRQWRGWMVWSAQWTFLDLTAMASFAAGDAT